MNGMNLHLALTFLGGVGLFLLGMRLMTDGLKVAAGDALREILARGTATTPRGIISGIGITAVVQSSSAVIFATVGFVNAGLLTLFQAIGVIIGSNIGTTATSWLVALVGFKVDLQALALPAVAIGMLLRVTGQGKRRAYLGDALTGFGIFFLGLDVLKASFGDFGEGFDLAGALGEGFSTIPANLAAALGSWADPLGLDIGDVSDLAAAADEQAVGVGTFGAMAERFDGQAGAFAYLLFVLLYFPCVAATAAVYRETGARWTLFVAGWTTGMAYVAATVFYQTATFAQHPATSTAWIAAMLGAMAVAVAAMRHIGRREAGLPAQSPQRA